MLTVSAKSSILDIWLGFEYAPGLLLDSIVVYMSLKKVCIKSSNESYKSNFKNIDSIKLSVKMIFIV